MHNPTKNNLKLPLIGNYPYFFDMEVNIRFLGSGCDYFALKKKKSVWAFRPIADVLCPESHGIGRALLGMSPRTLREVRSSKRRFSIGAVRIVADLPKSDPQNLR